MNKYTTSFIISIFLSSTAFAVPPSFIPPGHQYSGSGTNTQISSGSNSSSHSSSNASGGTGIGLGGAGGSAGATSSSGGNTLSNTTLPSEPPTTFFSDGHIAAGSGNGTSFFVVEPSIQNPAPGIQVRDGQTFVEGISKSCDQSGRAGLPKCFTIGGK